MDLPLNADNLIGLFWHDESIAIFTLGAEPAEGTVDRSGHVWLAQTTMPAATWVAVTEFADRTEQGQEQ